jgi:hypothetical protein
MPQIQTESSLWVRDLNRTLGIARSPLSGCDSFFENEITSNRERRLCKLSSMDEHPRERVFIFFGQQLERALYCRFLASDYSCLRARNREKLILSEVSALLT